MRQSDRGGRRWHGHPNGGGGDPRNGSRQLERLVDRGKRSLAVVEPGLTPQIQSALVGCSRAQCLPEEIAATLSVELGITDDEAAQIVLDQQLLCERERAYGRARARRQLYALTISHGYAYALAPSQHVALGDFARQHLGWTRQGQCDDVARAIEAAHRKAHGRLRVAAEGGDE